MIKEAAILSEGIIYTGRRHNEIYKKYPMKTFNEVQGFVTEEGIFLNRIKAEDHARACGQLTKPLIGSILTSEDLW